MSPLTFTPHMKKVAIYRERTPIGRITYVSRPQRERDFRLSKPGWVASVYMGPVLGAIHTAPYDTWREASVAIEHTLRQVDTFLWRQRFREVKPEPVDDPIVRPMPADPSDHPVAMSHEWDIFPTEDDI